MGPEVHSAVRGHSVLQITNPHHTKHWCQPGVSTSSIAWFGTRATSGKQPRCSGPLPFKALASGHFGVHPQRSVELDTIAFAQRFRQRHTSAPDAAGQAVVWRKLPTLLPGPFQRSTHIGKFRQVDFSLKNFSGRRREQERDFHWRSRLRHRRPDRPV